MPRDFQGWLEVLFRRRRPFVMWAGSVFAVVIAISLLWPPVYQSTSQILVQRDRAQLLVSPNIQTPASAQQGLVLPSPDEQDMNSEVELLTSPSAIAAAVADLKPRKSSGLHRLLSAASSIISSPGRLYDLLHGTPSVSPKQKWEHKLAKHLKCWVIKRSNVIEVAFTSNDSQWSHDFLSRLLDHYLAIRALISHDPQAERFFNQQTRLLQMKLEQSENNLRALRLQTGITDLPEQQKAVVDQVAAFQANYRKNQSDLAGTLERIAYLKRELGSYPERVNTETKVVQNLALQTLKPQLLQLESERAELLTRYQPASERIKSIDARLDAAKSILRHENKRVVHEVSTDINPVWQNLADALAQAKVTAATLRASQQDLGKEIGAYQDQLRHLTNAGVQLDRLERQVDTDREVYLSYVRKGEEARAAQALNLSRILNVSVAQPPTVPIQPEFPNMPLNVVIGFILACGVGCAGAFWSEVHDRKIYSAENVTDLTGLPTVAVLTHARED